MSTVDDNTVAFEGQSPREAHELEVELWVPTRTTARDLRRHGLRPWPDAAGVTWPGGLIEWGRHLTPDAWADDVSAMVPREEIEVARGPSEGVGRTRHQSRRLRADHLRLPRGVRKVRWAFSRNGGGVEYEE